MAEREDEFDCDICGATVMEGYRIDLRFYCSTRCLASDGSITPLQALTARHTDADLALYPEERDPVPDACPQCGSTERDRFIFADGCRWPVGEFNAWHLTSEADRG